MFLVFLEDIFIKNQETIQKVTIIVLVYYSISRFMRTLQFTALNVTIQNVDFQCLSKVTLYSGDRRYMYLTP